MDGTGRRTVEYRADKNPREIGLLSEVQRARDLWGVGAIRPGLCRRVGHGLGLRDWASWDSCAKVEGGRGFGAKGGASEGKSVSGL